MKFIKVFFSTILIIAILVFLIAPPLVGLWIKHQYTDMLAETNKKNPNITMTILRYDLGWFHSKASVQINLHTTTFRKKVTAQFNIHHGPVVYVKQENKHRLYFVLADVKGRIPSLNLTGHSIWHFNNILTSRLSSPSFTLTEENSTIAAKNFQLTLRRHMSTHHTQLQTTIDSLDISNAISLKKVFYNANISQKGLINYGKQKLRINRLTLHNTTPLTLNNITATSNTTSNNGTIDMNVHYIIQSISKNALGINNAQIDFIIKDVNAKTLNVLLNALQDQRKAQTNAYPNLVVPVMNFLRQGLALQINYLYLKTDDGAVSLDGTLTIPKLNKDATFLQLPMSITADFRFQAPKIWIKQQLTSFIDSFQKSSRQYHQTPQQNPAEVAITSLQKWEAQNLLISSGNDYKARIQFQNGYLLINGQNFQKLNNTNNKQLKKLNAP